VTGTTPRVDDFTPKGGWPGTILTVRGVRFAPARDDNVVTVGGDRALVLAASATELGILAGENTVTGPVRVTTATGNGASDTPGAPKFFHGPQFGTPTLGVADQPVLVVLVFPTDQDPGTPAQRTAKRNTEMATFTDARRFWVEATYGATSWAYTFTDWLALPQNRDFYFWQQEDIDAALAAPVGTGLVLSSLHPLKEWSLQETRGGSEPYPVNGRGTRPTSLTAMKAARRA